MCSLISSVLCSIVLSTHNVRSLNAQRTFSQHTTYVQGERFRGGQVGGFLLLLFGTFVYNEVVKLPCVSLYPTEDELEEAEEARLRHAALNDKKKPLLSPFSREMEPSPSASPTVETFFSPKLSRFNLKLHT